MSFFFLKSLFFLILFSPLISAFVISFLPKNKILLLKQISLFTTFFCFFISCILWVLFSKSSNSFVIVEDSFDISIQNSNFLYGLIDIYRFDSISLFFVILTAFLSCICILTSWNSFLLNKKEYLISFLILESLVLFVFCVLDILSFYIFFESVLIPMYIIIGIWGSRSRKIYAALQLVLYTIVGSFLMLIAILVIYLDAGSTDYMIIQSYDFSRSKQLFLWIAFFIAFAVKVPLIPFHIWLPEAHVEAPTAGSVILAGVLLKLGTYGLLRFSIPLFPQATIFFIPLVYTLSLISIVYASLTTLRQIDLKKIIAYSSVAHMGFVILGLFSTVIYSFQGSIYLMLSHGIVSSGLFLCIGVVYDRYKTRLYKYYANLIQGMPLFVILFFVYTFSNLSFPGTSSFVGEYLILIGVGHINLSVAIIAGLGGLLGTAYSIWIFNRVSFGYSKVNYIIKLKDVTHLEFFYLFLLILISTLMGLYPDLFLNYLVIPSYLFLI